MKIFFLIMISLFLSSAKYYSSLSNSDFLNITEIKDLLTQIKPQNHNVEKLGYLLNTVFLSKENKIRKNTLQYDQLRDKNFVRVIQWNLETYNSEKLKAEIQKPIEDSFFSQADIFTLNNIGYYNEQSDFQDMAKIIAEKYNANYVFAPEFLEASPELLQEKFIYEDFKALRGNAIVSKFPIIKAKTLRLPACYDWFYQEEQRIIYEPYEDFKAKKRPGEGKLNLIRRGGRVALIAELLLPNHETITVVSSQLENRAESRCRLRQLEATMTYLKDFRGPIVYGVDLNNFGKSQAPKSFSGVVEKTVKDPKFYAKQVISRLNPFSLIASLTNFTYGKYRTISNPGSKNIPYLLPNRSYQLIKFLKEFEFNDGSKLDFSGIHDLANSNQRKNRSYIKTYEYQGLISRYNRKLDWIFVKPTLYQKDISYYPVEAFTIRAIEDQPNSQEAEIDFISKHYPITVKLVI